MLYLWGRTAEWFCFGDQVPNFWRLGCVKIESQIFRFLMVNLRKITTDLGKQCEMTCTRFSLENDLQMVDVAFGSTFTKFYPIGSMYGIYANIGGILVVNVPIYSIHGSYGYGYLEGLGKS